MTEARDITLGGKKFAVPPLPLRVNRIVYPICRQFGEADLLGRTISAGGQLTCSDEEFDDLLKIIFLCAKAADDTLTQEEFDGMPITPPELLDAFFVIRYQTGAWVEVKAAAPTGDEPEGEAEGAESPQ